MDLRSLVIYPERPRTKMVLADVYHSGNTFLGEGAYLRGPDRTGLVTLPPGRLPLLPVMRGPNTTLGSACPPQRRQLFFHVQIQLNFDSGSGNRYSVTENAPECTELYVKLNLTYFRDTLLDSHAHWSSASYTGERKKGNGGKWEE